VSVPVTAWCLKTALSIPDTHGKALIATLELGGRRHATASILYNMFWAPAGTLGRAQPTTACSYFLTLLQEISPRQRRKVGWMRHDTAAMVSYLIGLEAMSPACVSFPASANGKDFKSTARVGVHVLL
jgi:hypothetical protein